MLAPAVKEKRAGKDPGYYEISFPDLAKYPRPWAVSTITLVGLGLRAGTSANFFAPDTEAKRLIIQSVAKPEVPLEVQGISLLSNKELQLPQLLTAIHLTPSLAKNSSRI